MSETARKSSPAAGTAFFWRHPWAGSLALVALPLGWFLVFYIAALAAMFLSAFWQADPLSGLVDHTFTLDNFRQLIGEPVYRVIAARTILIAAAVTLTDALLAWPVAYLMARHLHGKTHAVMMALVTLPLWSSTLARIYAWRLILGHNGVLNWTLGVMHLPPANIAFTNVAIWLVFSYLWLPFMILPLAAALERIPQSLFDASDDLGAGVTRKMFRVVLPIALPGLVAGSIFTFSLTLGDYVTPMLVGGASSDFIGNVVYANVGVTGNIPFAAAFATLPLLVMGAYLLIARRLGAFDAL